MVAKAEISWPADFKTPLSDVEINFGSMSRMKIMSWSQFI